MNEMPAIRPSDVGRRPQGQGDVGQRPGRHQPDPVGRRGTVSMMNATASVPSAGAMGAGDRRRRARSRRGRNRREVGRCDERAVAAGVDGHVDPEQVAHDDRVVGGRSSGALPGDRGDAEQVGVMRAATTIAIASSWPGSQSRMIDGTVPDMTVSMPSRRAHCRGALVARRTLAVGAVCRRSRCWWCRPARATEPAPVTATGPVDHAGHRRSAERRSPSRQRRPRRRRQRRRPARRSWPTRACPGSTATTILPLVERVRRNVPGAGAGGIARSGPGGCGAGRRWPGRRRSSPPRRASTSTFRTSWSRSARR